jgi:hypothetical protein
VAARSMGGPLPTGFMVMSKRRLALDDRVRPVVDEHAHRHVAARN